VVETYGGSQDLISNMPLILEKKMEEEKVALLAAEASGLV